MGGLGGGLLKIVEMAGEGTLFLLRCFLYLLIGKVAWKLAKARWSRLVAGCMTGGLVIGTILYTWLLADVDMDILPNDHGRVKIMVCFVGTPVVFGLFIAILEAIRAELEKKGD